MPSQHGYYLEDMSVGMSASFVKTITDADIVAFAGVSGDTNPVHLDDEFAEKTMFKSRIAHGMLSASLISTVAGTKLPGPGAIYISQTLKFKAPVRVGDTVDATCRVIEVDQKKGRVTLACECLVKGKAVLDGEAVLMVSRRPTESA